MGPREQDIEFDDELAPGPKKDMAGFSYAEAAALVAAIFGIFASFMPWGKSSFGFIIYGIDMDGILTLFLSFCALAIIFAWKDSPTTRRTGVWLVFLGAVMLVMTSWDYINFNSGTILSYSLGFYLQLLCGAILLIAGILCMVGKYSKVREE
jgi:hypothetical protein